MYASIAQARAVAVDGLDALSDQVVADAVEDASDLVDRFTGRPWGQQARSLVVAPSASGRAWLPVEPSETDPVSIVDVRTVDGQVVPLALWHWVPALPGGSSYVQVGSPVSRGSNMLVKGAEPWAGGWDGFAGRRLGRSSRIVVAGTFGTPRIPTAIQTATAVLAVVSLGRAVTETLTSPAVTYDNVKSISEEGFSVTFENPVPLPVGRSVSTTGNAVADRLLDVHVLAAPRLTFH